MNTKRIRELASQMLTDDQFNTRVEEFAQLIVQECISIVDKQKEWLCEDKHEWSDQDYGYEMALNDASMGIKQFFGVKE